MTDNVSASAWIKGITFSVLASIIGGASKLAIRKSWLMEANATQYLLAEMTADEEEADHREEVDAQQELAPYLQISPQPSYDDDFIDEEIDRRSKRNKVVAYSLRLAGMIGMTFLNPLCCVIAMNYASPSILAPFSGLTLVWIVLFSKALIGEIPRRPQVMAATLVIIGEVFVAAFGDHKNDEDVTLEQLRKSYLDPWFLAYLVGIALWMLILAYWMICGTSTLTKRFAWGAAGGSITGLQNFLKDSLTIVKAREGSFPWYLPVMVLLAISTSFVGLLLLTACMKRYDATYSSAMFVGSFVISASFMSAVHYNTFSNLEAIWNYFLYPLGLVILMTGVYILVHETSESFAETERFSRASRQSDEDSPAIEASESTKSPDKVGVTERIKERFGIPPS